jgi:hypothetical protein
MNRGLFNLGQWSRFDPASVVQVRDRLSRSDSGRRRRLGTRLIHTASGAREEAAGALTHAETGIV